VYVVSNPAFFQNFTVHRPDISQPGALAPGKEDDGNMDQAEGLKERVWVYPIIEVIGYGVSYTNLLGETRSIADLSPVLWNVNI